MGKQDSKPIINDLIFRELIKRGYSLEGNTRVWNIADSKLWYLTPEQAQGYLDLEKDEKYQKNVIQKVHDDIINMNDNFNCSKIFYSHNSSKELDLYKINEIYTESDEYLIESNF